MDDFFPNVDSGFRIAEYNLFLQRYANLTVNSTNAQFAGVHAEHAQRYPAFANPVRPFDPAALRGLWQGTIAPSAFAPISLGGMVLADVIGSHFVWHKCGPESALHHAPHEIPIARFVLLVGGDVEPKAGQSSVVKRGLK